MVGAQIPPIARCWVDCVSFRRVHSSPVAQNLGAGGRVRVLCGYFCAADAFFAIVQLGCSEHAQIYSPDGKHVLVVSYIGQGALGADYANIFVRPRWSPFAKSIFHGEAQWDFKLKKLASPEIKWIDNSHLVIGYYGDATCEGHADNIKIICAK